MPYKVHKMANGKYGIKLIDRFEIMSGPPDEARDNSGQWTKGAKDKSKVSSKPEDKKNASSGATAKDAANQILGGSPVNVTDDNGKTYFVSKHGRGNSTKKIRLNFFVPGAKPTLPSKKVGQSPEMDIGEVEKYFTDHIHGKYEI